MFFGVFDNHKVDKVLPSTNYFGVAVVLLSSAALVYAFGYAITRPAVEVFDDLHDSDSDSDSDSEHHEE